MPPIDSERALVLASTSSYRAEALRRLGLPFTTAAPRADETPLPGERPDMLALRLAHAKAAAVAESNPEAIVIGSDQVGSCNGRLLSKPGGLEPAVAQLSAASGQAAEFYTAVAVHQGERKQAQVVLTELWASVLAPRNIVVHAMHPGWADTPGVSTSLPRFYRLTKPFLRSAEQGADTIVWLCAADEAGRCTGKFWHDRISRPTHRFSRTRETEQERHALWAELCRHSGWSGTPDSLVDHE